jgi:hypothetical protein
MQDDYLPAKLSYLLDRNGAHHLDILRCRADDASPEPDAARLLASPGSAGLSGGNYPGARCGQIQASRGSMRARVHPGPIEDRDACFWAFESRPLPGC